MADHRIRRLFARAREQFFPDWDADQEWQVVAGRRKQSAGETGYSSAREKRIYIDAQGVMAMPDEGLLALIIHEMCHSVCDSGHTERWLAEMERAGRIAERLNELELSRMIYASAYTEIPLNKTWRQKWCKRLYPLIQGRDLPADSTSPPLPPGRRS
jgi:SprT-like family